ncbi:MAG TPA: phosphoglycerate kinase [Bacteroidota bacterium]|jgi:phosphoglycerate kinase|nr:phosphoglycerate kinase [Bacteroidota bacterium]
MNKKTIDDVSLKGKKVLVRVDFNVPLDDNQKITDDTRIRESLPTIKKIISDGGSAILMSHLGRPKGKINPKYSLKPTVDRLSELLGVPVKFSSDCRGVIAKTAVDALKEGEVLILENLRFYAEEEANDVEMSKELASYGDIYVNDAFGSAHRAHASTEGVTKFIKPCVAGYLMKKEIDFLGMAVGEPKRPYVAILGGAKIAGKIDVIQNLMKKVDVLLIGGGMSYTFFKAMGLEVGKSILDLEKVDLAKSILEEAKAKNIKLLLPVDCVAADKFAEDANTKIVKSNEIPNDMEALDIGPETIELYSKEIKAAKTVVWNGPMGVFEIEKFAVGTNAIAKVLAEATKEGVITIIGGGDSAAAITKIGLEKSVSHVSTGGGASLEFLEGKVLPGVAALDDK